MSHAEGMRALALALPVLFACTVDPSERPAEPAEAPAPAVAPAPAEVAPAEAPDPLLSPDVTPVQDLSAALQRVGRLMNTVRDAIQEAGRTARGDECAKARTIFLASNDALRKALEDEPLPGGRTPPTWQVAPAPEFARLCHSLPAEVQRCVRLDARFTERAACTPVLEEVSAEQQDVIDQLAKSVTEEP